MNTKNTSTYRKTYLLTLSLLLLIVPFSIAQDPIKIMPLGNSITYDNNVTDSRPVGDRIAYRYKLYQLLNSAGYNYDYVGSEDAGNNFFNDTDYDDNAGFPGITPAGLLSLIQTGKDPQSGNACVLPIGCDNHYIEYYAPDIILLHIGTNNLESNADADNHILNVESILNEIDNVETTLGKPILVFLAQIIDRKGGEHVPTEYYNQELATLVNGRSSDHIVLVDMENDASLDYDLEPNGDMIDTYHPAQSGYDKMAQLWFNELDGFNEQPQISDIANQVIPEGTDIQINLDDYIADTETADEDITWTISPENPANYTVTIDASRVATISPKNGSSTPNETITFIATDNGNVIEKLKKSASDDVTFSVSEVNNPPVVSDIPGESVPESTSFDNINLDNYVSDDETPDQNIVWTYTPASPVNLNVSITNRVASISVKDPNWRGSEEITFVATDEEGASDSDAAVFEVQEVNDQPVVSNISNQSIGETGSFTDINLDNFVDDEETPDNLITWSFSPASPTHLNVSITNRVASISRKDPAWRGSETITFTATDGGGLSAGDAVTFTVTEENDNPIVSDIPDQSITDNESFTDINLSDYVTDEESADEDIFWSHSATSSSNLNISISNKVASISPKDNAWRGSETITFTATDQQGLSNSDDVTFTVTEENDSPVITNIADQTVLEGSSFSNINLDNFISDEETSDELMEWSFSPSSPAHLNVSISNDNVVSISVKDSEWNGSETITFTATDEGGLQVSDDVTFTVEAVNDPPQVSQIPDQTVAEGNDFQTISLDTYVTDDGTADENITWSYTPANPVNLDVAISAQRVATITVKNENWNGQESITFTATDEGSATGSSTATFTVTAVNDEPTISDIPDLVTSEGIPFSTFDLDDFIDDVETSDANITWTKTPASPVNLEINISADHVVTATVDDEDWTGSETITFNATDGDGATVSDNVTFTVLPNEPPTISDIPDQEVDEGEPFSGINLDDYISDKETLDENMVWSLNPDDPTYLDISIGPNRLLNIIAKDENWNGEETIQFTATDQAGASRSDNATFRMLAVNDIPIVSDIPNQSVDEGQAFNSILLDNYVSDVETAITDMQWSYSTSLDPSNLIVDITPDRQANVSTKDENWNGSETVTFTATDEDGGSADDEVTFEVQALNDPPVVDDIPDQTINEGNNFTTIDLNGYVSDIDNLDSEITWSYSTTATVDELSISINNSTNIATIDTADSDWNGSETVTFTATDLDGAFDSDDAIFTVQPVNDAPVVEDIPDQTVNEGENFTTIDLNGYVSDIDNLDSEITWSYSTTATVDELSISINNSTNIASIDTADSEWNGSETIEFTATDPGLLSDSYTATFTVNAVNDAPVVSDIPDQTIDEGEKFTTIDLNDYVSDVDNLDSEITWSYSTTATVDELSISINNSTNIATIDTADSEWNGSETIEFTATDPGLLSDSYTATFTVNAVNDAPVVSDIPDQTIDEGENFESFDLDNFIFDVETDTSDILWTISSADSVSISYDPVSHVVTIDTINSNWNFSETITFTAEDEGGIQVSDDVTFTVLPVNDAPVVSDIPAQAIKENHNFSNILLNQYVEDIETPDADIQWSVDPIPQNLIITFKGTSNQRAEISRIDPEWQGTEIVTFVATDDDATNPLSDSDTVKFTVIGVDDPPVVDFSSISQPVTKPEGVPFDTINLNVYLTEDDGDEILWTYAGDVNLQVDILQDTLAAVSSIDTNWFGTETITFTANDLNTDSAFSDSDDITFKYTADDDPPIIEEFTVAPISEGDTFPAIPLVDYLTEFDGDPVLWSASGMDELDVKFSDDTDTVLVTPPDTNWFGTETIRFFAEDQRSPDFLADSIDVTFTVQNVDDSPELAPLPVRITQEPVGDQGGAYSFEFPEIDLMSYLTEYDGDDVNWLLSTPTIFDEEGNELFNFTLQEDTLLVATLVDDNWFGDTSILVTVKDIGTVNLFEDTASAYFSVTPNDDPPFVENAIPNINVGEDADSIVYSLFDVFEDVDDPDSTFQLTVPINTNEGLVDAFIADSNLIIKFNPNSYGSASITARAEVNGKNADEVVNIDVASVNDPPYFRLDTNYVIISTNQVQTKYVYSIPEWVETESVSYELSPASISFANVSINSLTGTITIQTIIDSTGQQEFSVIADDGKSDNNIYTQQFTLAINVKVNQTIEFTQIQDITLATETLELQASASSGLPVSFEVLSGPAALTGDNTLQILGTGTVAVRASQGGDDIFNPAPNEDQTFTVSKIPQTIDFPPISDTNFGIDPFKLEATATSGLPVDYSVVSGSAVIENDTMLNITGVGQIILSASQNGNETYEAADVVYNQFFVSKAAQSITFDTIPDKTFGDGPLELSAIATSGLPVSFSVISGNAFVNGDLLTITGSGDVTVRARQSGNTLYASAPPVDRTFDVVKASQSVILPSLSDRAYTTTPISLNASATSGLPVEFEVEGNGSINEDELTLTGIGDITILAFQSGNQNYLPSDTTVEVFNVYKASQNISFSFEDAVIYGMDPIELNGTTTSGLPVQYEVTEGDAYIENGNLIPNSFGNVTVKAFNNGNELYLAATPVYRSIEFRQPSVDGALTQIITPSLKTTIKPNRPIEISVKIKNVGNIEFNEVRFTYVVDDSTAVSSELYRQLIAPGDSVTFQFSSLWTPREEPNSLCVYVEIENDTVNSNDSLCMDLLVGMDDLLFSNNLIRNVYPNPADDYVTFEFGRLDERTLFVLYDSKGKVVKELALNRVMTEYQLSVREFADGMYFYKIISANRYFTGKFVKK